MNRPGPALLALSGSVVVLTMLIIERTPAQSAARLPQSIAFDAHASAHRTEMVMKRFTVPLGSRQLDLDVTGPDKAVAEINVGLVGPAGPRGWSEARSAQVHIDPVSATYGFLPGPIEAGEWTVVLDGLSAREERSYRVSIRLSDRVELPPHAVRRRPDWFAGDLHVHSGHSDGYHEDAAGRRFPVPVRDLVEVASRRHLDFLAITDHNTASHWIDVDRAQEATHDVLLLHGREITTERGHFNAIGERRFTNFLLGPARPMRRLLQDVGGDGAFLSINHGWLTHDEFCGGCGWIDRDPPTVAAAQGFEVINGSTPDPTGTLPGWRLWSDLINRGSRLVAVGGSDVHDPASPQAAIGQPATVVYASELSELGIVRGLKSGRVFIRATSDARGILDISGAVGQRSGAMGQQLPQGRIMLTAHVVGARGSELVWFRRGSACEATRIRLDDEEVRTWLTGQRDDWFSAIVREPHGNWTLISNAIYIGQ